MRVDNATALFAEAERAANYYFGATLQVNMLHVLAELSSESEVPADFLSGSDAILSNASFRLPRANILASVIRRAAALNLPETGLGDNWRMCQVAEIPMFNTGSSVHGWNDRRRDPLLRKASHRATEANVFGFGLQTAL